MFFGCPLITWGTKRLIDQGILKSNVTAKIVFRVGVDWGGLFCPWRNNKYYIFWVCDVFVTLDIQQEKGTRSVMLSCVACRALPRFSILSHKLDDFRKKNVIKRKMCVLICSTTFFWKISLSKKCERDMIKIMYWSSCKGPNNPTSS
jgi:hypothetical protein